MWQAPNTNIYGNNDDERPREREREREPMRLRIDTSENFMATVCGK